MNSRPPLHLQIWRSGFTSSNSLSQQRRHWAWLSGSSCTTAAWGSLALSRSDFWEDAGPADAILPDIFSFFSSPIIWFDSEALTGAPGSMMLIGKPGCDSRGWLGIAGTFLSFSIFLFFFSSRFSFLIDALQLLWLPRLLLLELSESILGP